MSTKISDLTSATSLTGVEEVPIVQTGTTKKTTVNMIKAKTNEIEDITNAVNYTVATGITISIFEIYKAGSFCSLHIAASYTETSAGTKKLLTFSNLTPITQAYGGATTYSGNAGAKIALGRIKVNGDVDIIALNGSHEQCEFTVTFLPND